jgi:RNA-binding protein NOB1
MASTTSTQEKPIHSLILDTGPLIKNAVSISTLINTAEELYTTPAIISEIRDAATRSRVQTTLMPFLKVRTPSPASYDAVIAFSKKTGDHAVLSRQDLGILALAYEVHCERNGGNWGLREVPKGQIKRRHEEIEAENARKAQKAQEEAESAEQEKTDQGAAEEGWSQPAKKRTRKRGGKKFGKSTDNATEQRMEDSAIEQTETGEPEVAQEGWEQPTGKKAAKSRAPKPTKFKFEPAEETVAESGEAQPESEQPVLDDAPDANGGVAITQEQVQEQIQEQVVAQVQDQIHEQVQDQIHEQLENKDQEQLQDQAVEQAEQQIEKQVQEQVQEQLQLVRKGRFISRQQSKFLAQTSTLSKRQNYQSRRNNEKS